MKLITMDVLNFVAKSTFNNFSAKNFDTNDKNAW